LLDKHELFLYLTAELIDDLARKRCGDKAFDI
jgi:hypothetical protein